MHVGIAQFKLGKYSAHRFTSKFKQPDIIKNLF